MPLSPNEIRARAIAFSREWKGESSEDAEAKSFWDAFFNVFGITRRRIASFEKPVKKHDGKGGYIDLLWKGMLLVEHKSLGHDLDRAFHQATDYFQGLRERDLPRYVIVSDFARFRLYDLEADDAGGNPFEFPLSDLHKHIGLFGFVSGYQTRTYGTQRQVDVEAAEELGLLHDLLRDAGYTGHPLEVFLVRVLFCLFAEDNGIFEPQQFREWIDRRTGDDGSDLGPHLNYLFQVLNTEMRAAGLDETLAAFRYINGRLFEETIPIPPMNRIMREKLLQCTRINWSKVSPAIFGALFQSIMDRKARRNLGAHYTSETNILKALEPLFLDDFRAEFGRIRRDSKRLGEFHEKLANIRILDPACGCGNFLVVAYRELRLLELEVLRELFKNTEERQLNVSNIVFVDVDQFYGIEIEEFPAQIAQVALWMTDHQMNQLVSTEFGQYFARLPLKKAPKVVYGPEQGNALRINWADVVPPEKLSYIVGNPPFKGKKEQKPREKRELRDIFHDVRGAASLDYVACWYRKAADLLQSNPAIEVALVATNSITQGEQAGLLWPSLLRRGVFINFAHRTFQWTSEARGKAAVHCIIVGFSLQERSRKTIFDYETVRGKPLSISAARINPYLVDADNIVLLKRRRAFQNVPKIAFGSMPNDDGHLLIKTSEERDTLIAHDDGLAPLIREFIGSAEFISGEPRYCFWLVNSSPNELRAHAEIVKRCELVRKARRGSDREETKKLANLPSIFGENRQPLKTYLAIPKTSSETRLYIPMAFLSPDVIVNTELFTSVDAGLFGFGVLTSLMHMAWVRSVCGRLKSDYRYSAGIVYNNFPWPEPTLRQKAAIETAAQAVLDDRARHPKATLADLYDPLTMPPSLVKAHQTLDRAVDVAYGKTSFSSEAERVGFLFNMYERITSLFPTEKKQTRSNKKVRRTTT